MKGAESIAEVEEEAAPKPDPGPFIMMLRFENLLFEQLAPDDMITLETTIKDAIKEVGGEQLQEVELSDIGVWLGPSDDEPVETPQVSMTIKAFGAEGVVLQDLAELFISDVTEFKLRQTLVKRLKGKLGEAHCGLLVISHLEIQGKAKYVKAQSKAAKAKAKADPKGKAKAKAAAKPSKGDRAIQLLLTILRVQRLFRRFRVTRGLQSPFDKFARRKIEDSQKVALFVDVKSAKNMPTAHTSVSDSVMDPYIELRAVDGDPMSQKDGNIEVAPLCSAKTKAKENDGNPVWNETLVVAHLVNREESVMQVVLWDKNMMTDQAVAHWSMSVPQVIEGMEYDVRDITRNKKDLKVEGMKSLTGEKDSKMKTTVNLGVSMVEVYRFQIKIIKAASLPRVDTAGTIDAFIQLRALHVDPRKLKKDKVTADKVAWSDRTAHVSNSQDPKWNHDFHDVDIAGVPSWWFQFNLMDHGMMGETAVGHFLLSFQDIIGDEAEPPQCLGGKTIQKTLKLEKYYDIDAVGDFKRATLKVEISYDIAIER